MTLPFCSQWHLPTPSLFTQLMFRGLAAHTGNAMTGLHVATIADSEKLQQHLGEQTHYLKGV